MKTKLFYNIFAFALCAMAVTSCSENIVDETLNEGLQPLSISVVDEGYINADASSRAVDEGAKTTFVNGDKIGVYVVSGGTINQKNVAVTYDGSKWNGEIFYFKGSDYIAYYPYIENLGDCKTLDELKTALSGKASDNQSDENSYRKADYLTAEIKGVSNNSPLKFNLAHNKSLVEVNIPVCEGPTNTAVSDLAITVGDKTYTPYYIGDGNFRCVVTPSDAKTSVVGYFKENYLKTPVEFKTEIIPKQNAYNRLNITYDKMPKLIWGGNYFQGGNTEELLENSEIILPADIVTNVQVARIFNAGNVSVEVDEESNSWLKANLYNGGIAVTTIAANQTTNKENVGTITVTIGDDSYTMTVRQCMKGYGTILNKQFWDVSIDGCTVVNNDGVGRLDAIYDNKWSSNTDTEKKLYAQLKQSNSSQNCIIIIDLGENHKEYNAVGLMPRLQWTAPAPGRITVAVSGDKSDWTTISDYVNYYVQTDLEYKTENNTDDKKYENHYEGIIKWVDLGPQSSRYIKLTMPYSSSFWSVKEFFCFDEIFVTNLQSAE